MPVHVVQGVYECSGGHNLAQRKYVTLYPKKKSHNCTDAYSLADGHTHSSYFWQTVTSIFIFLYKESGASADLATILFLKYHLEL